MLLYHPQKYARSSKLDDFLQSSGWKYNIIELPVPRFFLGRIFFCVCVYVCAPQQQSSVVPHSFHHFTPRCYYWATSEPSWKNNQKNGEKENSRMENFTKNLTYCNGKWTIWRCMSYIKWFFLCIAVMLGYRSFMWTKHDSDDTVEGSEIQPSLPC